MTVARTVFLTAVWTFNLGVLIEGFLIGMVVVAGSLSTAPHVLLGHALLLPLLVMAVTMYTARYPQGVKALSWLLLATYVLQTDVLMRLRTEAPALAALHPALAFVAIVLGVDILRRASQASLPQGSLGGAPGRLT